MEEFLPSEIARAVYGYLLSEGCEDAAKTFLETSPNLVECKQRVQHGKRLTHANTLLLGKNMVEVLNVACSVHSIVKQIHEKHQRGGSTDGQESLTELLDQLRSCVFSDTRIEEKSCSQPLSQLESQSFLSSPHHLRTPPTTAVSLAENYRSLVQECSEGLDLSLSPEKNLQQNKNVESPSKNLLSRPTSAPGSLGLSQLEMDNETAVEAITGIGVTPLASSVQQSYQTTQSVPQLGAISSSSLPTAIVTCTPPSSSTSNMVSSSTVVMATASVSDQPETVTSHCNQTNTADGLPDPPIIVLNNQNQSFEGGDMTSGYFNVPPCATSTPQVEHAFMPEDTAFIIYPPLVADQKPKKARLKEKSNLRRSGRLRKLLPKPPRKDPPHIVHVKVLPQTIDEENEDESDETSSTNNEIELAKELPDSEEKVISENECERSTVKEGRIEKEKNIEVVATTSDKENVSDENILKGDSAEKLSNNLANEAVKEATPKPPPLRKNISRSTPRRNSHVRALSFNTPLKPTISRKSNTSPKMPKIKFSPRSTKLSCVKRSSLFSPQNNKELSNLAEEDAEINHVEEAQEEIDEAKRQAVLEKSPLYKVPIATRSPAPKLSNAWQEVNDIKITEKPIWDEKIRNFALGDFEDPAPPPKNEHRSKQTILGMSPNKVNKSSLKNENYQSPKKEIQNSNQRKSSRLKKRNNTPLKCADINTSIESVEPLEKLHKEKTTVLTNSKTKITNKRKKYFPVKKTRNRRSVLSSKEKLPSCSTESNTQQGNQSNFEDPKTSIEDNNEKFSEVIEMPSDKFQVEGKENIEDSNILLEDLVLSSNSCFPHTNESNDVKNPTSETHGNETILQSKVSDKTDSTISSSPIFLQPNMLVLETPSKDFQGSDSKMFALTTPLIKSVRQETSILEEDLLLTPSLPPTPHLDYSPRNLTKTPCKMAFRSPDIYKTQAILPVVRKEKEDKLTQKEQNLDLSTPKENVCLSSVKENNLSKNSDSEAEGDKGTQKSQLENVTNHGSIQSISKPSLTTTTDTSEDEIGSHGNKSGSSNSKSYITNTEKMKKKKILNVSRNRIYSTTESSDSDINDDTKVTLNNGLRKTKLSKLASVLLENERKSLNQKCKRVEEYKKHRITTKNPSQHSLESLSSANSSQDLNKSTRGRKKEAKRNITGGKKSIGIKNKSSKINIDNNDITEKQVPINMRQQLQSDLLKRERKMIFGEGFPSSSDSESDSEIFESKKNLIVKTKTKFKKNMQKKKILDDIIISEESSLDDFNKDHLKSDKCVRFKSKENLAAEYLKSPNKKENSILIDNSKESQVKSVEVINSCCQVNNVINPPTLTKSSESLEVFGQGKGSQGNISNDSGLTHDSDPTKCDNNVSFLNPLDEHMSINNCHELDKDANRLSGKNSEDTTFKQSDTRSGSESNLGFKNIIPNKCSINSKLTPAIVKRFEADSPEKAGFADKNENAICKYDTAKVTATDTNVNIVKPHSLRLLESYVPTLSSAHVTEDQFTQNSNNKVEEECPRKEDIETENEICITSTSTCKKMDATPLLDQLDFDRRDTFEVDEREVTLSYSQIIKHHYYSPFLRGESNQSKKFLNHEVFVNQNFGVTDKKVTFKEQSGKRRIQLIPIEDDKYEQKLRVDYDIDHVTGVVKINNRIIKLGNRRPSDEVDILDCNTSSILSPETSLVNTFEMNPRCSKESEEDIMHKNQKSELDGMKSSNNETNTAVNDSNKSYTKNEIKIKHSVRTQEKTPDEPRKHNKYVGKKGLSCEDASKSRSPRNQRSYHSRHHDEREAFYEGKRIKSRYEKESPCHSGRRKEQDDSRQGRLHNRRDYDRSYSDRRRREMDRRGFSERRIQSSHGYSRRDCFSDSQIKGNDRKRSFQTAVKVDDEIIKQLKQSLSKIEKHDLDRVDKLEKTVVDRFINPEIADPRAAQILTYSDTEKNESSRDEADSLMDFAVITKTKDKRSLEYQASSTPVSSIQQDPLKSNKRKACIDIGESHETSHVEKKLKLGEVEMKEAKSVLKHKMADMLNVLHPDTSNEAS